MFTPGCLQRGFPCSWCAGVQLLWGVGQQLGMSQHYTLELKELSVPWGAPGPVVPVGRAGIAWVWVMLCVARNRNGPWWGMYSCTMFEAPEIEPCLDWLDLQDWPVLHLYCCSHFPCVMWQGFYCRFVLQEKKKKKSLIVIWYWTVQWGLNE